jgi:hypothetical protein
MLVVVQSAMREGSIHPHAEAVSLQASHMHPSRQLSMQVRSRPLQQQSPSPCLAIIATSIPDVPRREAHETGGGARFMTLRCDGGVRDTKATLFDIDERGCLQLALIPRQKMPTWHSHRLHVYRLHAPLM